MRQPLNPSVPDTGRGEAVALHALSKTYRSRGGAVAALREVTLAIAAGSSTAVMALSGSGKSTLLQCAAGPQARRDQG